MRMRKLLQTQLGRLRLLGFVEGISLLLILGVTMPLKYALDIPAPNRIAGTLHGVLFVLYVFWIVQTAIARRWKLKTVLLLVGAAIVPFGPFWADHRILKPMEQAA